MSFELKLNKFYNEIAQQINDMIPTDWDSFYFNGEIKNEAGGVYFFFKPKDEEQYVYSHFIPKLYNIDKTAYNKELHRLFQLTVELQKHFIENNQEPWFSVTLIVDESNKLNVQFDYTNWHDSEFGPADRIEYFRYKYLKQNKEQLDIYLVKKMKEFEEK